MTIDDELREANAIMLAARKSREPLLYEYALCWRRAVVVEAAACGVPYRVIGEAFGISHARARQIADPERAGGLTRWRR
jgi:hypothetical protein